jgi:hypothetical protein
MGDVSRDDFGEFVPEAGADMVDEEVLTAGLAFCVVADTFCSIARRKAAVLPTPIFDPSSKPSDCPPTGGGSLSLEDAMIKLWDCSGVA